MWKKTPKLFRRPTDILIERLEDRILFDAVPDAAAALAAGQVEDPGVNFAADYEDSANSATSAPTDVADAPNKAATTSEIVFVDRSVVNYESLVEELFSQDDPSRQLELVFIELNENGIEKITETLASRQDVDAIHLLSHGTENAIQLGNVWLDQATMTEYSTEIKLWGNALADNADLLIYGCNFGAGVGGAAAAAQLAALTGADIAASEDLTGSELLGGDWDLELQVGEIETHAMSAEQWFGLLNPTNLSFTSPTLVSGTALQVGAVYRFANVTAGVDALVTIDNLVNGATITVFDQSSADPYLNAAFNPEVRVVAGSPGSPVESFAEFSIDFVESGTSNPVGVTHYASPIDVDGNNVALREFWEISDVIESTIETGSELIASYNPATGFARFEASTPLVSPGIDPNATTFAGQTLFNNSTGFTVRIGGVNEGAAQVRLTSLAFAEVSFIAPVTTRIGNTNVDAVDDAIATRADLVINGSVFDDNGLGADSDPDGDPFDVTAVNGAGVPGTPITLASGALVTVNADGTFAYDPNGAFDYLTTGQSAIDSFVYTITDQLVAGPGVTIDPAVTTTSDTATVTVTVYAADANIAPVARPDSLTTAKYGVLNGDVLANNGNGIDFDADADPLTVAAVNGVGASVDNQITLASGALLTVNSNGTFTYDPNGQFDFLGPGVTQDDFFDYTISDGNGGTDTDRVTITVTSSAAATFGGDDTGAVIEDTTVTAAGTLTVSDPDPGEATLVASSQTGTYGDFAIDAAGNWTYNLNNAAAIVQSLAAGETVSDNFTVSSFDGTTHVVSISVTGTNDAPVANNDANATNEDTLVNVNAVAGVLNNDTDLDGDSLAVVGFDTTSALGAVVTVNADGSYVYDPTNALALQSLSVGASVVDTFSYTIEDPFGQSAAATVSITVTGVDDGLLALNDSAATNADTPITMAAPGVLANDGDPDGPNVLPPVLDYVAASDTTANSLWENETAATGFDWTLHASVVKNTSPGSSYPGITESYVFTGAGGGRTNSFADLGGDQGPASFEIWFKPTDAVGNEILFETGAGDGVSAVLNGNQLQFKVKDNGNNVQLSENIQAEIDAGEFIHFVGTVDTSTGTVEMYVDGSLRQSGVNASVNDWSNGNNAGLGVVNGNINFGSPSPFVGEIAIFHFFDSALTASQVQSQWDAVAATNDNLSVIELNGSPVLAGTSTLGAAVTISADGSYTYDPNPSATLRALAAGETSVDSFTYTIQNAALETDTATAYLTVTGVNDSAVFGGVDNGAVVEDTTLTTSGVLTVSDVDNGQGTFVASSQTGTYGAFTMDAAGNWTYNLDNSAAVVQALAAGETVSDNFTVTSDDGSTHVVSITVTGANDSATFGGDDSGAVVEDTTLTTSGVLTVSDIDNGQGTLVASSQTGTYGAFTMDAAGNWTYNLDNSAAVVQALAAGETVSDNFTVTSDDGSTHVVSITVTGANDSATFGGDDSGAVVEDTTLTASGILTVSDIDNGQGTLVASSQTGTYGAFAIDAAGNWTYNLDNSAAIVQALAAGETVSDNFTVTSDDGSTHVVSITVTGANDSATFGGDDSGAVVEDATPTASGVLTVSDIDNGQGTLVASSQTGTYGSFDIDAAGNWTYNLDNSAAVVQALAAGETVTDNFTVTSDDGSTHVVSITVTGANDSATFAGDDSGAVVEDTTLTTGGVLTVSDTDNGQGALVASSQTGTYGAFAVDAAGNWTYNLDNSAAVVQALAADETVSDNFTVTSDDGSTHVVSITVTGANDSATFGGDDSGAVVEDTTLTTGGVLTVSDTDNGQGALVASSQTGTYGAFAIDAAGNWTYNLDNSSAICQALAAGETVSDTFTVTSDDGSTHVVSINVTGANDPATFGGDDSGAVVEDATPTAGGVLTVSDVDNGQGTFVASSQTGTYGAFTMDAAGNWTYNLDNSAALVQALAAGETVSDNFTVTSDDGTTHVVSITVTGANDSATFGGDDTGAVVEDTTLTTSGVLTVSDIDNGQGTLVASSQTGTYGAFIMDALGNWTYNLDNSAAIVQALAAGETVSDNFTVTSDDGTTHVVSVTVTGANDSATFGGDDTGAVVEDTTLTTSGVLTVSDIDNGQGTLVASSQTGTYGAFIMDALGNWTYNLDNSAAVVQALAAGETVSGNFTVTSDDGTTHVVSITVTGANDSATFGGDDTGAVVEDTTLTTSGVLTVSDIDNGQGTLVASSQTGTYGAFAMDAAGNWTYNLDNSAAIVQALAAGETVSDNFTVTSDDGSTHVVSITVTGANDSATFGGDDSGAVVEDTTLASGGVLTVSDIDNGQGTLVASSQTGTYGAFAVDAAGNWTYNLDNSAAVVQALAAGETVTDNFTVTSDDGSTHVVSITVTGANDSATFGGDDSGAVVEDTTLTTGGVLTVSDTDNGQGALVASSQTGTYGAFAIDAGGNWTYNLDNSAAVVQALAAGETVSDNFTVTSDDGSTHVVSITVTGANDAATFGGVDNGAVVEDTTLTTGGVLTVSDIDNGQSTLVASSQTGTYGAFEMDAAGNWTYNLDNSAAIVQALAAGETVSDNFTVTSDDGTTHVVSVTVTGANDPAVFGGGDSGAVVEDTTLTASGVLTVSDTDNGQGALVASSQTGTYGAFAVDAAGNWTYNLDNSAAIVQALAAGETVSDNFTVTSDDGSTHVVSITVTGANDPAVFGGDDSGAVVEDATPTAGGGLTVSDIDIGQATLVASSQTGAYGDFTIDAAGNWTYNLDNSAAVVQALAAGETVTDNFTVTSDDGSTHVVSITVTGANDPAVFGGGDSGAVVEDTTLTASGVLTVSDLDNGQGTLIASSQTGTYGAFAIDAAGNWTYNLDNSSALVQALAAGETVSDNFTVTSDDGTTHVVSITVTGANDSATFAGDDSGAVVEDATPTAGGVLTVSDIDIGQGTLVASSQTGAYGDFTIDAAGNWTYNLDNSSALVQALAAGETVSDNFTVTSDDGSAHVVSVTITGVNDSAVFGGVDSGAVVEDTTLASGGVLTVSDIDNGQGTLVASSQTGTYGAFAVDAAGNWTYNLDNSAAIVQALAAGETVSDNFTVTSDDGSTHVVSITVTGANDPAVFGGDDSGAVIEDTTLTTGGVLTVSDTDNGQGALVASSQTGTYGAFAVDAAGNWTYNLDNSAAIVQALAAGETVSDNFTVTSDDGTTHVVSITVTGANDSATFAGDDSGAVVEDTTLTASGILTVSDTDNGQGALVASSQTGTYGAFAIDAAGNWTYNLDNSAAVVQALAAGETVSDNFTVTSDDGSTHVVSITVTGANDAATFGGVDNGAVVEDTTLTTGGVLTVSDIDNGQSTLVASSQTGTYGAFEMDAAGNWTYNLDNSAAIVQALAAGETVSDNFTVTSDDGTTHVVSVTVTGANDPAVFGGGDSGAVVEDTTLTASGVLTVSDTDNGQGALVASSQTGTYGAFAVDAAGNWTYNLDNSAAIVQALAAGETVSDNFTVTSDDGSTHVVSITVTGANDPAVFGGDDSGAVVEDATPTAGGGLTVSDIDIGQATLVASSQTGAYGDFTIDAAGNWTYNLDNSAAVVQALAAGETVTDNFTVTSDDGSTHVVSITVTGANDPAVFGGGDSGAVVEDTTLTASGVLTVSDLDNGQGTLIASSQTGTYGAFAIDAAGNWTYNLDNSSALVQALAAGETVSDNFTVTSDDGTTHVVSITVTGANDSATFAGDDSGAVVEDATPTAGGVLTVSDIDIGQGTLVASSQTGAYGDFTIDAAGNWTYNLDNSSALVQALAAGETVSDNFTVTSDDGSAHVVSVTITGVNDSAVFGGVDSGAVVEDTTLASGGVLTVSDIDNGQGTLVASSQTGTYGAFAVDAAGNWTYNLDNSAAIVQALAAGETVSDNFTVTSDDGSTHVVSITVTGANDPAVFGGDDSGAVIEDTTLTTGGVLTVSDTDNGQGALVASSQTGTYGAFAVDAAGNWTYNLDNSAAIVQALAAGETVSDNFTVTSDDGTTHVVSITVTGANDSATFAGDDSGAVVEDTTLTASGILTVSDTDNGQGALVASSQTGTYGAFAIDAAGNWTYNLDNSAAVVQALAAGETVSDNFTVTSDDGSTHVVSITVTGANDAATFGGVDNGAVVEDTTLTTGGVLTVSDIDNGQSTLVASSQTGTYGAFEMDAAGNWTYNLDNSAAIVQALAAGETVSDNFTVTSDDGTTHVVSVTVTGANDPAVFGGGDSGAVVEDTTLTASGVLTVSDTDNGQGALVASSQTGTYGAFAVDAAGNWTYNLDNSAALVQALAAGETVSDNFTVTSDDGTTHVVSITVTGANDSATFAGDDSGAVVEDATPTAGGVLTVSDIDIGQGTLVASSQTGAYGDFTIDAAGNWTYNLDNSSALVQALAAGETVSDNFTVTSDDGSAHVVSVTITGVNDSAVFGGVDSGAVVEDTTLASGGVLTVSDIDNGQGTLVASSQTGTYGAFAVDAAGNWTYNLDNSAAIVQALAAGETVSDNFTVTSDDGSTHVVSITVTGANDAATFGGDDSGAVIEDTTLTTGGVLTVSDTDNGQGALVASSQTGTYGAFAVDAAGNWTYNLDNSAAIVQALAAGETVSDNFTVTSDDGTTHVVSITVTGANDSATFAGDDSGAVVEDTTLTASGILTVSDTDNGQGALVASSQTGTYGAFAIDAAGNWTYNLDNSAAVVQALAAGETVSDNFTVTSDDGSTHVVSITVTGANDSATFGGDDSGAVVEDTTLTASGILTVSDIDNGQGTLVASSQTGTYGAFAIDAAGNWTYNLNNSAAIVQALAAGETVSDNFTVTSDDGSTHVVVVTITGVNDSAVFGGVDSGAVVEDTTLASGGVLTVSDIDNGQGTLVASSQTGTYGAFAVDAAGNWTYNLDNSAAIVQALAAGETVSDNFTVTSDDGTTHVVLITVTGTNDSATFGGDDTGAVVEDTTLTTSGVLTVSDIDNGQGVLVASSQTGTYGAFAIDAGGNWSYNLDNSAAVVQALAAGETVSDNFTVTSDDGTTHVVSITVTGANDSATFGGDDTGAVVEDATPTAGGVLTVSDIDNGQSTLVASSQTGTYGAFEMDAAGNWTYNLDNSAAIVQALAAGETVSDNFTVTSDDGTTHVVSVTVTGANDPAVFGAGDSGAVVEDTTLTTSGVLTVSDVDNGQGTLVASSQTGTYGAFAMDAAGNWTYNLDNSSAIVQSLAAGETVSDSFTVTSDDGTTHFASITVTGANDSATFGGDDAGAVVEETTLVTGGVLTVTDIDNGQGALVASSQTGTYGAFAVDAAGNWTYNLNNSSAIVQSLSDGETVLDNFTVTNDDGTTHVVSVTVTGANDSPNAGPPIGTNADEDDPVFTFDLLGGATDPDASDVLSVSGVTLISGDDSGLTVAGNLLTINPDAYDHLAAGQTEVVVYQFNVDDGHGGSSTQTATITIAGLNDAPVANDNAAVADEGESVLIDAAINDTDVDDAIDLASIQIVSGPAHGTVTVNSDGTIVYNHDGSETIADSFSYTIEDQSGASSNPATVLLTITPRDDAPVAVDDMAETDVDVPVMIYLTNNDVNPDGGPLNVTILTGPANGTTTMLLGSAVTYTPNAGYTGMDYFMYQLDDGAGHVSTAMARVRIAEPFLFAFDSFNNQADSDERDEDQAAIIFRHEPLVRNVLAPLPIDPIFSGIVDPGATVKLTIYDKSGNIIGETQVVADAAGNWIASFPNKIIWKTPHHMTAELTPSLQGGDDGGFNLRRYFHPSLHESLFFSERLTVAAVVRNTPHAILDSIHAANNNPLTFSWGANSYESATSSTNVSRM